VTEDGGGGGGRGGWSRGVRRGNTLEVAQEDRGVSLFGVKVFMILAVSGLYCICNSPHFVQPWFSSASSLFVQIRSRSLSRVLQITILFAPHSLRLVSEARNPNNLKKNNPLGPRYNNQLWPDFGPMQAFRACTLAFRWSQEEHRL